jgi:Flp pilus assembly protein TadG
MRFGLLERLVRALRDRRGGTAVIFALAAPALALLACGAIDLAGVNADRGAMQDTADSTALAMAKQLSVSTAAGISARAQTYAVAQLGQIAANDAVAVTATIGANNGSVTVGISGHRNSFFGNMFPPGGWTLNTQATASVMGELPLCVLSTGASGSNNILVQNSSIVTANGCLVQSNQNIAADSGANLTAGLAQAVGTATGPITPSPQTGAPAIADPFASLPISPPPLGLLSCLLDVTYDVGVTALPPGTQCGNITVKNGATVTLASGGVYYFTGQLNMQDNSTLIGSNVVLIFDSTASFNFSDSSTIQLSGAQSGNYAGFVIITTRDNTNTFTISSTNAKQLEGAVYIPAATLQVTGTNNSVANQSAWTVVVAQSLKLQGSPNLVINSNYSSSTVPVPGGVGANYSSGKVSLTR